jgi:DnaJ-class molecular chaperone
VDQTREVVRCPHCDGRGYVQLCLACEGDGFVVVHKDESQLRLIEGGDCA